MTNLDELKNPQKIQYEKKNYVCEFCNYNTFSKKDYNKHLLTDKHKKLQNTSSDEQKNPKNPIIDDRLYKCNCGKSYKHQSSLCNHKKKCNYQEKCVEIIDNNTKPIISQELVLDIINENKEQRNQIQELTNTIKELVPQIGNNNTNNSHNTTNNQFSINVFLNEQCKDAINMSDFIKSIEVSLEQLDFTKTNGLEKGISNVIMENMSKLSLYERPVHCTDVKRETLYIKDNDTWEKDKSKEKIKQVIKKASNKNYTALTNWTKENPDFMEDDDKQIYYAKAMSKLGKPIDGIHDKIVKKICNETYVKDNLKKIDN
tara:strand:+ start:103 stop:1050 length:948 start_codon:yes stop_codon:yes gene_type:complete